MPTAICEAIGVPRARPLSAQASSGTHVRSSIGRRSAMLVHGDDRYGHWDRDPEPKVDADPACLAYLDEMWARYQDKRVKQAAEAGLV